MAVPDNILKKVKHPVELKPDLSRSRHICCVLLVLLFGVGVGIQAAPQRPVRWSDAQLQKAVADFGQAEISKSALRKLGEPHTLLRVAKLQRMTHKDEALHYYSAFTLAYFGKDYRRNLRALIYPIQLYET